MDGLISCYVVSCSKRATNWFVAKLCPSTKEVKGIKINLDFIFNNFPVHCTGLRLVVNIIVSRRCIYNYIYILLINIKVCSCETEHVGIVITPQQ
jgi:hypothetical protein